MRDKKRIEMIRNDNADFYQKDDLLKNESYVKKLGQSNSVLGLIYIAVSAGLALSVKDIFWTYRYVLQSSYMDLGSMEVREWAAMQMRGSSWDAAQIAILAISAIMTVLVVRVSFFVKKYDLYKHQGRYLFELVALAVIQTLCAAIIPCLGTEASWLLAGAAFVSWLFQVVILLPQIFGGEMFYPLEIKNVSGAMEVFNCLVELFLKRWLNDEDR